MTRTRIAVIRIVNSRPTRAWTHTRGPPWAIQCTRTMASTAHPVTLTRTSPAATTRPTSHRGAFWGFPPARRIRCSSRWSSGSLTLRTKRGQGPNGVIRPLRTAQWVTATIEAYASAAMTRMRTARWRTARKAMRGVESLGCRELAHLHWALSAGSRGAHERKASAVGGGLTQDPTVAAAGNDLASFGSPVRHGNDGIPLHVYHAADGGRGEALHSHLGQVGGRTAPVDRTIRDRPVDQIVHLGAERVGALL